MDLTKINETPEIKLHFLDYWRVIRLRKSLILTVFLLVMVTAAALTFWLIPPKFASMARIRVEKDSPEVPIENRSYGPGGVDPFFLQTEFQVIQSSSILNGVITNLQLDQVYGQALNEHLSVDETYQILLKHLNVQNSRNTSLIEIWVESTEKKLSGDIANKIAQVYKEHRLEVWKTTQESGIRALQEQLNIKIRELAIAEAQLDELRIKLNIPETESGPLAQETIHAETLRYLERYRVEALQDLTHDSNLLSQITKLSTEELRHSLATIYPTDSDLVSLAENWTTAEAKFVSVAKTLGAEHPDYKNAEALLKLSEKQLDAKIAGIVAGLKARVATELASVSEYTTLRDQATAKSGAKTAEYRPYFMAKRQVENLTKMKELLENRVITATVEAKQPLESIVQIVDAAKQEDQPVSPNKTRYMLISAFFGLAVGILLAFFIEYLDTSVKTIDDVERSLQAPVLGVIPQHVGVLLDEGMESPHAEAYRVLRTNVLFSRKSEGHHTISVLSAGAGEGKSTTLCNLATIFAQNGHRVLLVDSDLRRPSLHKMVHVANNIGLTNYLLKQNKLEEVIVPTKQANLDFLPSGKLPSSSMGILSSVQMKEMIQEMKKRYEFVFFDSPPLLGVSDASILTSQMDMVLQVIQYRRYPQPMTIRAKQMITKIGGNLLGIVLNNINMSQDENYYYYSGYYEYEAKQNDDTVVKLSDAAAKSADGAKVEIKQKY